MADGFQGAGIAAAVVARLRLAGVAASIRELPPWPSCTPEVGTAICVDIAGAPRPIALAETWRVRAFGPHDLRAPSWTWDKSAYPLDGPARIPEKRMAKVLGAFAESWAACEASLGLLQLVFALKDLLGAPPAPPTAPRGSSEAWCAQVSSDEAWIGVERGGRHWPAFLHIRSTVGAGEAFEIVYPGAGPDEAERRWRVTTRGDLEAIAPEVKTCVATLAAWCVQFVAQRQVLETFAARLCVALDSQPEGQPRFWRPLVASTDTFSARERPSVHVQWRDEHLSGGAQLSVDDSGQLVLDGTPYRDDTPMKVLQDAITVKARGALYLSPGDDYRLKQDLGGYETGVVLRFLKVQETHTTTCFQFEVVNPALGRGPELVDGMRRYRGLTLFADSPDDARVMDAMADWFEPLKDERDLARRVNLLVEMGTYLREQGAFAAARERLEAARALDADHPVATFQLGWVAAQEDRWDDALVLFARAAELDPAGAAPKTNEAWALGRLGRWSEALAILDALAQRSPDFADAHRNRGWVLRNLGRLEEARSACEQALALSPTYAGGLHEAGLVAMSQQRWDDAVAYLERAVALAPVDAVIAADLAAARAAKA